MFCVCGEIWAVGDDSVILCFNCRFDYVGLCRLVPLNSDDIVGLTSLLQQLVKIYILHLS